MEDYTQHIQRTDVLLELTGYNHRMTCLLNMLMYWWQNSNINIEDHRWMTKLLPDIANSACISLRTLSRDLAKLHDLGLIEKRCYKDKVKFLYIRITDKVFDALKKAEINIINNRDKKYVTLP